MSRRTYTTKTVDERILSCLQQILDVHEVSENTSLSGDLGMDSLDIVEFIMALEDEFGIEISEEVTETVTTIKEVKDALEHIRAK